MLFVHADEPVKLSELAERAGTSLGGTHKEVERLEAAGLVKSTTVGRTRLVEPDQTSPIYPEMRGLLLKVLGPSSLLRSALSDIDGIDEAFIYGSWADPSQTNPADIDLLVIGEPEIAAVYDAVSEIEAEVGRPINVTVRSPAEWEDADGAFERAVRTGPQVDLR
ncbi:MAG: nucleotidyltransferase domain-containing protein [Actinomycetota bacterium]